MSYTNRSTGNGRAGTIVAVAALHVAAAYALINGLGIDYVRETIANLPTRDYSDPPAPESDPAPKPPKADSRANIPDAAERLVPISPGQNDFAVVLPPLEPLIFDVPLRKPNPPVQTPRFEPVTASPRTNPGSWISTNDYPTREIRQENEGTTTFRLSIDANGKVQACDILRSSGHQGLDDAACRKISSRARFDPARDGTGSRVPGSYTGTVTWVIPR